MVVVMEVVEVMTEATCQGHQESAFTADWWAVIVLRGVSRAWGGSG